MANSNLTTDFPVPGLRDPLRYITGHNSEGEAVFLQVKIPLYAIIRVSYIFLTWLDGSWRPPWHHAWGDRGSEYYIQYQQQPK